MTLIPFTTKLARFHEAQEHKGNKPMSKHLRTQVAKKLAEEIDKAKNPKLIAELANVLAKYLPKQTRKKRSAPAPIEKEELSLDDLVATVEKKRKGRELSVEEHTTLEALKPGDEVA